MNLPKRAFIRPGLPGAGGADGCRAPGGVRLEKGHLGRGCAYGFSASICGKIEMAAGLELKILLEQIKTNRERYCLSLHHSKESPGPYENE